MTARNLPLHDWHEANKATFVELAGHNVPRHYGKVEAEYGVLRNGMGYTDLCHEARFRVEGRQAAEFLNASLTLNVDALRVGKCRPTFICNPRGGIIDRVTVYREESYFLLLASGVRRLRLIDWFEEQRQRLAINEVQISDVSTTQRQVAVVGPRANALIEQLSFSGPTPKLEPGDGAAMTLGASRVLILRRSTLALPGYDLVMGGVYIQPVWERLTEAARLVGARVVGTEALDTLRIESGLPAIDREIDEDTTPLELDQAVMIDFQKRYYTGKRALVHSTMREFPRTMVAVRFDGDAGVLPGSELYMDGMTMGRITSSVFSPLYRGWLGLGFVSATRAEAGQQMMVQNAKSAFVRALIMKPGTMPPR